MPGVHDMGGRTCDTPVKRRQGKHANFDQGWQSRTLAMTLAAGMLGRWNIDASRYARESLPQDDYRQFSYYEVWLAALANLLVSTGLIEPGDLEAPEQAKSAETDRLAIRPDQIVEILSSGSPTVRPASAGNRFRLGQQVRANVLHGNRFVENGHTRLPAYVQGRCGVICRYNQAHILPDANAHFLGEYPEHLYSVCFPAQELWGAEAGRAGDDVVLDLWESYLEPV